MIEISPKEYWIECTYNEAKTYLEFLVIEGKKGWRVAKFDEWLKNTNITGWDANDMYEPAMNGVKLLLVPVRVRD